MGNCCKNASWVSEFYKVVWLEFIDSVGAPDPVFGTWEGMNLRGQRLDLLSCFLSSLPMVVLDLRAAEEIWRKVECLAQADA